MDDDKKTDDEEKKGTSPIEGDEHEDDNSQAQDPPQPETPNDDIRTPDATLDAAQRQIGNLTTQVQSLQAALDKALHMQKTLGIGSGGMVPPADDKTTPTDPELISVKSLFQTN